MTLNFKEYPTYSAFRTLQLLPDRQDGFDVYALQLAITRITHNVLLPDGNLGPITASGIKTLQAALGFTAADVDGRAGLMTQRSAALYIARQFRDDYHLPSGLLSGQIQFESSYWLGRYSPKRSDGSYDAGIAQMNTNYTLAEDAYDPAYALQALAQRVSHYYMLFAPRAGWTGTGVSVPARRWQLAQGTWNAPAYACWVASREGAILLDNARQPSAAARTALENYMINVSALTQL